MKQLRDVIAWAMEDELVRMGIASDDKVIEVLHQMSDMLTPHYGKKATLDFTMALEDAFQGALLKQTQAAFLMGARWARDPLSLFEIDQQPAELPAGALVGQSVSHE